MDIKTIDTYNKMAKDYDAETIDFWQRFPSSIIDEFVKRAGKGRVLDVGSGPGRDGLILKDKGCEVFCIDASKSMVELCISKGLDAVIGDLLDLPFKKNEFDGVWSYTSLLHVKKSEIDKALSEINRVLKTGGVFGLGLIEGNDEMYKTSSGIDKPRWFAHYSRTEIEELLKKHNFEIVYFEEFRPGSKNYLNFVALKNNSLSFN